MKAKIDENGLFYLEKKGEMIAQKCCFHTNNVICCTLCPLFKEPEFTTDGIVFEICQKGDLKKEIVVSELQDDRPGDK